MVEILNENDNFPVFAEDTVHSLILSEVSRSCKQMCACIHKLHIVRVVCLFIFFRWLQWIRSSLPSMLQMQTMTPSFTPLTRHQWVLIQVVSTNEIIIEFLLMCLSVFVGQPDAEYFRIDLPNSGEVVLSKPLDYETKTLLTVTIHASVSNMHIYIYIWKVFRASKMNCIANRNIWFHNLRKWALQSTLTSAPTSPSQSWTQTTSTHSSCPACCFSRTRPVVSAQAQCTQSTSQRGRRSACEQSLSSVHRISG